MSICKFCPTDLPFLASHLLWLYVFPVPSECWTHFRLLKCLMLVCVLEGPLSDCTCVFYFFIRRAGRSCLVGGLGAALKKQGGLNQSIWSLKCLLDDSYVEGLFSSIPPLLISKWRLSVETCGIWWGFLRSLQYLSKMILSGKVHQVLVWLWDAVSVPEFCFKVASVTCCGCRNQLQEPGDLLTERKFVSWRATLTHFIHLSGLVVILLSEAGRIKDAQVWLSVTCCTELAKQGDLRICEGFSKQAHLLCQNYISSVGLLRITYLEDYVPWSQVFILHLGVNQSMTLFVMLLFDMLVLLGKDVVFFF